MAKRSTKTTEQLEAELTEAAEARGLAEGLSDAKLAQRLDVLVHRVQSMGPRVRDALLTEAARRLRSGRQIEGADAPRAHL
jgi:hypothetical protein